MSTLLIEKLQTTINKYAAGFLWAAICFTALSAIWLTGYCEAIDDRRPWITMIRFIGDCAVILLPYWWLRPRWRWSAVLPVWGLAIWWLLNLWYARFWGDLLSAASVTMAGNVNSMLLNSIKGVWRPVDLTYILLPLATTLLLFPLKGRLRREPSFTLPLKMAATAAGFGLFILSQLLYAHSFKAWFSNELSEQMTFKYALINRATQPVITRRSFLLQNGFVVYSLRNLYEFVALSNLRRDLTDSEIEDIERYLAKQYPLPGIPQDSTSVNPRNVIFLVVESLNAEVLNYSIDGHEITPVMNRLVNSGENIVFTNLVSQVRDGGSGDGQLIYNTGLLPLAKGSAAIYAGGTNRFETLANRFEGATCVIFSEDASAWNEYSTFSNYGFSRIVTSNDFTPEEASRGADAAMFMQAEKVIPTLAEPFFVEMITSSMHVPFIEQVVKTPSWLEDIPDLTEAQKGYLVVTNYFDAEFGKFMEWLNQSGLADSTTVILASDHSQSIAARNIEEGGYVPAVFMAVNSGRSPLLMSEPVGQVDVYPTILDLCVFDRRLRYSGVGHSVTAPDYIPGAVDPSMTVRGELPAEEAARRQDAYRISDLILRGDFFNRQKYPDVAR